MTPSIEQSQQSGSMKFARDVIINVLANLIAAAIIYLLGVMIGAFPKSPHLIATAMATIFASLLILLFVVVHFIRGSVKLYFGAAAMFCGGVAFIATTFTGKNYYEPIPLWATFIMGLVAMAAAVALAFATRMLRSFEKPDVNTALTRHPGDGDDPSSSLESVTGAAACAHCGQAIRPAP